MKVYITRKKNGKYNYLVNWIDTNSGNGFFDWYQTLKDIREYFNNAVYVHVNF